jgi:hypothetical protein
VLPGLPYLALSSSVAVIRLVPVNGTEKDVEVLALRHQLAILQRQIDKAEDDRHGPCVPGRVPAPAWAGPAAASAVGRRPGHDLALAS